MYEESVTHEITPTAAPSRGLSRRQLVKAGVWAAPVVVLATASPAAAGSRGTVAVTSIVGTASGSGNGHSYLVDVTIKNNGSSSVSVTANFTTGGGNITAPNPTTATKTLTAGEAWTIEDVAFTVSDNGQGKSFSVSLNESTASWTFTGGSRTFKGGNSFS